MFTADPLPTSNSNYLGFLKSVGTEINQRLPTLNLQIWSWFQRLMRYMENHFPPSFPSLYSPDRNCRGRSNSLRGRKLLKLAGNGAKLCTFELSSIGVAENKCFISSILFPIYKMIYVQKLLQSGLNYNALGGVAYTTFQGEYTNVEER